MLKYNPKDRFSAEHSLAHKWFKKFDNTNVKPGAMTGTIQNIKKFHVIYNILIFI
jgi:hypothetical protein